MNDFSLTYLRRSGKTKIFLAAKRNVTLEPLIWKQAPQTYSHGLRHGFATLASKAAHGNIYMVTLLF